MGADSLQIRRYGDADRDAVWHLHNLALGQLGPHPGNGPWDADLKDVHGIYLSSGGEFLVAFLHEHLVAMGALKRSSHDRAEIKRMRVHPQHQRKGFGRAILLALERRAVEFGFSVVHLDTTVNQAAAQRLYENAGYSRMRQERVGVFEFIYFEKRLVNQS